MLVDTEKVPRHILLRRCVQIIRLTFRVHLDGQPIHLARRGTGDGAGGSLARQG